MRQWSTKGIADEPDLTHSPNTLPKISTTRILTNNVGSAASARAAVAPVMPTDTPQNRLHIPTVSPAQKMENPAETRTLTCQWKTRSLEVKVAGADRCSSLIGRTEPRGRHP